MCDEEIVQQLNILSDTELLYKEYYEAHDHREILNSFLNKQDKRYILENKILIPEMLSADEQEKMISQLEGFDKDYYHRVSIHKYPCYLPPYEHVNHFFEIIYVLRGTCIHSTIRSKDVMKKGDLCLISNGMRHSVFIDNAESVVLDLRISISTMSDLFSLMLRSENTISLFFFQSLHSKNRSDYLLFHTTDDVEIKDRILEMYNESRINDQYTSHLLNNMLNVMLIRLIRNHSVANAESTPQTDEAFKVIYYLTNHYLDTTLEKTAKTLGFSPAYCSRYIKSIIGLTYSQLINKMRFEYVAKRLLTTNDSITCISNSLGYENPENFIRAFKKYFHMTPTQYRRQASGISERSF